jgi:hypothetical protein
MASVEEIPILLSRMTALPNVEILRLKNGFFNSQTPGGYRDVKLAVKVGPHVCELQIHVKEFSGEFLEPKENAHKVYEWARRFDPNDNYKDIMKLVMSLDLVQEKSGAGSVLFKAIETRNVNLVKCFLMHPRAKEVVNGTSDSWPRKSFPSQHDYGSRGDCGDFASARSI